MEDNSLDRLVDQLTEDRVDKVGCGFRFVPLGSGGKRYAQAFLKFCQPVPGTVKFIL